MSASKSTRLGLMLVFVAALTLEMTNLFQFFFSLQEIREKASIEAARQLNITQGKMLPVIDRTESSLWRRVWQVQSFLDQPDSLESVIRHIVSDTPVIVGSSIAFVPGYNPSDSLYAPYVFESGDSLILRSLATQEYDYPAQEWFREPLANGFEHWSEPYFDEGGGDILMTTYSIPIQDKGGNTAAVITADVSLDWLTDLVGNINFYPDAFSMVLSRTGRIMVSPVQSLVMNNTVWDIAEQMDDPRSFRELNQRMLARETGSQQVKIDGKRQFVYFAPVLRTGWIMSLVVPRKDIFRELRNVALVVLLLQLIGLAMLYLILHALVKGRVRFEKLSEKKERMDRELHIASDIQMSMIPKASPSFPARNDLDIAAAIDPAKEVGGDLYDYFLRDGKLFFCIGDVSGKGIPASLVMAVTRTAFRTISAHEDSPEKILKSMNKSLADMNDKDMFVTFFCGVLDPGSGHLRYCNAGHNPPLLLTDAIHPLQVAPNLPLGILPDMVFTGQETTLRFDDALFLYTDGLTEAENSAHEQFGDERVEAALHGRKTSEKHLENIRRQVSLFVGDAPQSDDLTMLFIHYLGSAVPSTRHLGLHNDINQISRLPKFVEDATAALKPDPQMLDKLNLALEEIVTNIILYAYPEGTEGTVDIDSSVDGRTLCFVISDSGTAFDPTAREEVDITTGVMERPIGGLGIHLVRQIMDSVSYERKDNKNILTITKKLQANGN